MLLASIIAEHCILNQTRGFWLLSDALLSTMKISMKLQVESNRCEMHEPPLRCGEFDSELEIFYGQIAKTTTRVLNPVLDFTKKFSPDKAHNMVAIMVDPRYKGLQCVSKFVGPQFAKVVVAEYDAKVVIPLLYKASQALNVERTNATVLERNSEVAKDLFFV